MITRNALRAIALATTCLAPFAAYAQGSPATAPADTSAPVFAGAPFGGEIGIGAMGVFGHNPDQAGRYSGLNTNGFDAVGEFDLGGRAAWNSGSTRYLDFFGNNLVFQTGNSFGSGIGNDSRFDSSTNNTLANDGSMGLRIGDQGTWGAGIYFNSITYTGNVIDSLYTVSGGQATLNGHLTPFGGATATKAGPITSYTIPTLTATGGMQPFQTGTRRDAIGGDLKYIWGDFTFTGAIRHEHKEGSMEEAFDGPYGGTAFALPINYDTDRLDLSAAYNTRLFQGILQYTFSHFSDNNLFVNLPYPTSNTAAPFQRAAAYSTPPSNDAQYLTLLLASNAIPFTRVNLNLRVGVEQQDNQFAPNTADPTPAGPPAAAGLSSLNPMLQGTSANSPDITAEVYQLKVTASTHPLPNLDGRVFYGLDARNVSLNQYSVNVGGTGGSSDSNLAGVAFVVPQDWLKQNAGGEVGYVLNHQYDTKLTVGYRLDEVDRSNAQVGHSSTNTGSVALSSAIGPQLDGRLSFDYVDRSGTVNYLGPWVYLGQGPSYSGAYYQAPMTSEAVTFRTTYTPMDTLSGDLFVQFKNENYTYSAATIANGATLATLPLTGVGQGLKQDYALSLGPDVDWRPSPNINVHVFYTYEMLFFNNTGNGACSTAATAATAACAGTIGYFTNQQTTATHTFGVSGEWKVSDKLKVKGDYTISYGSVMFSQFNGVFVPAASATASYQNVSNYPDINSLMNNVRLTATYEVEPRVELIGQVIYTQYHDNDWNDTANAIQGAGTSAISLLTPGYGSPNYSVVAVLGGVKFKF